MKSAINFFFWTGFILVWLIIVIAIFVRSRRGVIPKKTALRNILILSAVLIGIRLLVVPPIIASTTGDFAEFVVQDFAQDYCRNTDVNIPGFIGSKKVDSEDSGVWICWMKPHQYQDIFPTTPGDLQYIVLIETSQTTVKTCGPYTGGGSSNYLYYKSERKSLTLISLKDGSEIDSRLITAKSSTTNCPEFYTFFNNQDATKVNSVTDQQIINWVESVLPEE